ncbi:MAG: T9SS type A sorting domain-containing protein [Dyadobacter sp.]|uniref:T9SS type A sorting domain-containing protein n=1 Tax=Dyadobacter sp. TaxID=1914288 RepID=UPI003263CF14
MKNYFLLKNPSLWISLLICLCAANFHDIQAIPYTDPLKADPPKITVAATSLPAFTSIVGSPSAHVKYRVDWENITNEEGIGFQAPTGYQITAVFGATDEPGDSPFFGDFDSDILIPGGLASLNTGIFIFVRLSPAVLPGNYNANITGGTQTLTAAPVAVNGVVTPLADPGVLRVLSGAISAPSTEFGETSLPNFYLLKIDRLLRQDPKFVQITAPEFFEISFEEIGPFSTVLTLPFSGNKILVTQETAIFFRLKAGLPIGKYQSVVQHFNPQTSQVEQVVKGEVVPSNATAGVSPSSLTNFKASKTLPSPDQNYVLSATDLPALIASQFTILAPNGFQVSVNKSGPYEDFITIDSGVDDQDNTTDFSNLQKNIFVRLKSGLTPGIYSGDIVNVNSLTGNHKVSVSGEAFEEFPQTLTSSPGSIIALNTIQGTASGTNNFLVRAKGFTDLQNGESLHIKAPSSFEISLSSNGPFSEELDFTDFDNKGDLTKNVLIRIKSTALAGTLTGEIDVNVGPLASLTIPVTGQVAPPPATSLSPGTLTFSTAATTPSPAQAFTISGTGLPISTPPIIGVTATAPADYELALSAAGPFSDNISTLAGVAADHTASRQLFIRLKGTGSGTVNRTMPVQMGSVPPSTLILNGTIGSAPELTSNPLSLKDFAAELGKASFAKSYVTKAANFPTTLVEETLTLDAPVHFEIGTDEKGPYTDRLLLTLSNGALTRTIFVRLKTTAPLGLITGNLVQRVGTLAESIVTLEGNVVQVFPVTLVSFTGKAAGEGKTLLEWQTSEERENAGFEIQKSTDAKFFSNIGWIDGLGNANHLKTYTFLDEEATTTAYYRLKQIDFNGTFTLSRIVVVVPENESVVRLKAWPNPSTNGIFNVELPTAVNGTFLYDLTGKLLPAPIKTGKLDLTPYPSGLYMLKIKTKEEVRTIRLMKSN